MKKPDGKPVRSAPKSAPRPATKPRATPTSRRPSTDGLRAEYDFTGGERGKYARRFQQGTNVVVLEPDVATQFRSAKAVNRALRAYLRERSPESD